MEKITGNEPAMPFESKTMANLSSEDFIGLSIRQHYAGLAMQGFAASQFMVDDQCIVEAAKRSVIAADALIASLNSSPQPI